jgi:hypothetical protein
LCHRERTYQVIINFLQTATMASSRGFAKGKDGNEKSSNNKSGINSGSRAQNNITTVTRRIETGSDSVFSTEHNLHLNHLRYIAAKYRNEHNSCAGWSESTDEEFAKSGFLLAFATTNKIDETTRKQAPHNETSPLQHTESWVDRILHIDGYKPKHHIQPPIDSIIQKDERKPKNDASLTESTFFSTFEMLSLDRLCCGRGQKLLSKEMGETPKFRHFRDSGADPFWVPGEISFTKMDTQRCEKIGEELEIEEKQKPSFFRAFRHLSWKRKRTRSFGKVKVYVEKPNPVVRTHSVDDSTVSYY